MLPVGALYFGLAFCVFAAIAVLVYVALPNLRDDPELNDEPVIQAAKSAAGRAKVVAGRARDVAEAAAGKVADSASSIAGDLRSRR